MQQIRDEDTILAVTDRSYLEDRQASSGGCFYATSSDEDDNGQVVPGAKILFGGTI